MNSEFNKLEKTKNIHKTISTLESEQTAKHLKIYTKTFHLWNQKNSKTEFGKFEKLKNIHKDISTSEY